MAESEAARAGELVAVLRRQGYRLTPQRLAVIQALTVYRSHPSAEDVHRRVVGAFPMTSLATVYKTIDVLKEIGEVLELELGEGYSRYDALRTAPHPHAICLDCRRVEDLDTPEVAERLLSAATATGYQPHELRLSVLGVCPRCRGQRAAPESFAESSRIGGSHGRDNGR